MDGFMSYDNSNSEYGYGVEDLNLNYTINTYNITNKDEKAEDKDLYTREELNKIEAESLPGNKFARIFMDKKRSEDKVPTNPPKYLTLMDENVNISLQSCDPICSGRKLFTRKNIILHPNRLTPLIGCNGAGKSTTLTMIEEAVKEARYPVIKYDNLQDGGHNSISEFAFNQDYESMAGLIMSSEGEAIAQNVFPKLNIIADILKGKYIRNDKCNLFRSTDRVFVLMDAVDSGFSVDNLHFLKLRLEELIDLAKQNNKYLYIVICANSFEFASGEDCYNVQRSEYVHFGPDDYQLYKDYILKSRERIIKQWNAMAKKKANEKEE